MTIIQPARGREQAHLCYHTGGAVAIAAQKRVKMAQFDSPLDMAKTQVALRALRYGHFPADIFDEYAWDMMLHMYIAALRNQTLYMDNVVNLTSKNKFVGDRWIKHLIKQGLADCDVDKVKLSVDGFNRMNAYHLQALELLED